MESLLHTVMAQVQSFNWQSPISFLIIVLAALALLGRWGIIFLIVTTFVLGRYAHDLIVLNLQTSETIIGVPLIIYCVGGMLIALSLMLKFIRYMIL